MRVWLNPSAQTGDERGTESIVYFVDRRVVRQAGIRNQRGSQTGGDQEPAGESDRRGSGTRRRVRQAGIRNRQESQTGRGSITGKQGSDGRRVVRQAGVRRPENTRKGRRELLWGQAAVILENAGRTDTNCKDVATNWRRLM